MFCRDRVQKILSSPVVKNTFYLAGVKGAELILPLITFPYLVRVLGPEYFGLIAFAVAINAYFILITDYGFSLSATRKVSICRENKIAINHVFNAVMLIKFAFLVVCLLLLSAILVSIPRFESHIHVYLLSFGVVIGNVLFPVWLYQGLECMKYITILNLLSRMIYVGMVFIVIKSREQYWMVPALNGALSMAFGCVALIVAIRRFKLKFELPSKIVLKETLKDGWYVFQSKLAINVYTTSTSVILGFFAGNAAVGVYSAGEKIVKAVQSLYAPFGQAVYPYVCKLMSVSQESALQLLKKISVWVGVVMFIVSLLLYLASEYLVNLILGNDYEQSVVIVKILSFLPLIVALSNIYGIQTLLNLGHKKTFSMILLAASILGILLSIPLVYFFSGVGSAVVVLSVELFVTVVMASSLWFYKIDVFPRFLRVFNNKE